MQGAGYVLAGGSSTRMGTDKAVLIHEGRPIVATIASRIEEVIGNVTLVGAPERYGSLGLRLIPDLRHNCGPIGGIEAALVDGRAPINVIVSCDVPGVHADWIRAVYDCAVESQAQCVVCRDITGRVHPLLAAYRDDCLPVFQEALDQGRLRLMDALKSFTVATVDIPAELSNVNTNEDWQSWISSYQSDHAGVMHARRSTS